MDFHNFWQLRFPWNRQLKDGIISHLTWLVFLHYPAKRETPNSHFSLSFKSERQSVQVISLACFICLLAKQQTTFTQKDVTFMFSVLQGSTEAEKLCHLSTGHFPGKTAAWSYQSLTGLLELQLKCRGSFSRDTEQQSMNITAVQRLESSHSCIIITHTHGGMSTVKSDHARHLLVYLWLNYSNILHIHGGPVAVKWCTFFVF